VFFRLTDEEFENLEKYCQPTQRSKSDVFRELIRSLKVKKSPAYGRGFRPKFSVKNPKMGWGHVTSPPIAATVNGKLLTLNSPTPALKPQALRVLELELLGYKKLGLKPLLQWPALVSIKCKE
jgi:hypothetical protein